MFIFLHMFVTKADLQDLTVGQFVYVIRSALSSTFISHSVRLVFVPPFVTRDKSQVDVDPNQSACTHQPFCDQHICRQRGDG
jgi:hypothetical protein